MVTAVASLPSRPLPAPRIPARQRPATRSLERSPSGCWKRPSPVLTDLAGRPAASARLASPRGAVSDILPRGRAHPLRAAADRRTDTVIRDRCERPPRRHARPNRQWSARRAAGTARAPRRQAAGIRPEIPSLSCAGTIAATSPLFGQAPLPATPARRWLHSRWWMSRYKVNALLPFASA
jgi:hypothetical protein